VCIIVLDEGIAFVLAAVETHTHKKKKKTHKMGAEKPIANNREPIPSQWTDPMFLKGYDTAIKEFHGHMTAMKQ